jgi:plasmid rolling circle replication initiator protein Rep
MRNDKVMKDFNKERWKKAMKEEYEHMVMSEPIPHKDAG